jgi:hypothetical protein
MKLISLGVSDKEDRRLVLSALNAAGHRAIAVTNASSVALLRRLRNGTPGGAKCDGNQDVIRRAFHGNYPFDVLALTG